jgi:hypothetical protein
MRYPILSLGVVLLAGVPGTSSAAPEGGVNRVALVVGANHGAPDRVPLRYAITDADRVAAVLEEMGGVPAESCIVLHDPTRQGLLDALGVMRARTDEARRRSLRTELLFYYSGHADETGLMLGREELSYRDLRDSIRRVGPDVGITVLDACASGAITRLKGGQSHPAFLADMSSQMEGYAFLTSSSDNEVAQESERLQGSFFTHALLSGLRGAADVTGDGRVTLNEAYQFAFHETLSQTAATEGGAQHPAYDIRMAGTGDVVITDVRKTSCTLVLDEPMDGRVFVQSARNQLVAELYKPSGRVVELGLEPGRYEVFYEQDPVLLATRVELTDGQRLTLSRKQMAATSRTPTRRRGAFPLDERSDESERGLALNGRTRVEAWGGFAGPFMTVQHSGPNSVEETRGGQGGLSLVHWLREDWAIEMAFTSTDLDVKTTQVSDSEESVDARGTANLLFGARFYFPPATSGTAFRPYASVGMGPYARYSTSDSSTVGIFETNKTGLGAHVGLGCDLMLTRRFALTVRTGSQLRSGVKPRWGVGFGAAFHWGHRPRAN